MPCAWCKLLFDHGKILAVDIDNDDLKVLEVPHPAWKNQKDKKKKRPEYTCVNISHTLPFLLENIPANWMLDLQWVRDVLLRVANWDRGIIPPWPPLKSLVQQDLFKGEAQKVLCPLVALMFPEMDLQLWEVYVELGQLRVILLWMYEEGDVHESLRFLDAGLRVLPDLVKFARPFETRAIVDHDEGVCLLVCMFVGGHNLVAIKQQGGEEEAFSVEEWSLVGSLLVGGQIERLVRESTSIPVEKMLLHGMVEMGPFRLAHRLPSCRALSDESVISSVGDHGGESALAGKVLGPLVELLGDEDLVEPLEEEGPEAMHQPISSNLISHVSLEELSAELLSSSELYLRQLSASEDLDDCCELQVVGSDVGVDVWVVCGLEEYGRNLVKMSVSRNERGRGTGRDWSI
ncbi:hypothetical protein DACRYDRAFT_16340 [Dacryopinax primogenitus]|uniref:Uncharacterized protein n=1 Tax=Dacryopinax primogenitus (strain DJM 731) TaxID=1858805 RepID=M5FYJ7_DACPD|nr:uncharacterized protein DACRYDRAFT_16340 [Dacryopinax primogenitus]EJU00945.1 hypothetical protein DACRYDRAFT_16340 [Dacryopinax primogenitus]